MNGMDLTSFWVCPACGETIRLNLGTATKRHADDRNVRVNMRVDQAALADVAAHVWTHLDDEEGS